MNKKGNQAKKSSKSTGGNQTKPARPVAVPIRCFMHDHDQDHDHDHGLDPILAEIISNFTPEKKVAMAVKFRLWAGQIDRQWLPEPAAPPTKLKWN